MEPVTIIYEGTEPSYPHTSNRIARVYSKVSLRQSPTRNFPCELRGQPVSGEERGFHVQIIFLDTVCEQYNIGCSIQYVYWYGKDWVHKDLDQNLGTKPERPELKSSFCHESHSVDLGQSYSQPTLASRESGGGRTLSLSLSPHPCICVSVFMYTHIYVCD